MAVATQVTTFLDLFTDLQNRVRAETGVTATQDQAKRYINIALHDMHVGFAETYPWAERRGVLITHPTYTTGKVDITRSSATLAGKSSTLWNTNNSDGVKNMRVGGKFRVNGTSEIYEVSTVTGDTAATLTSNFMTDTVTDEDYTYFEDEYALASDFLRPVDQHQFADRHSITMIGRNEFRRRFAASYIFGTPRVATMIDKTALGGSDAPVRRVAFYPYPDTAIMINYHYITSNLAVSSGNSAQTQLTADTDEPIIPLRYRHAIVFHALYHWYRDREDDPRSVEAKNEYTQIVQRIVGDVEIGGRHARISPKLSSYVRRARRPWSSAGSPRFDIDNRFDHLEDL